MARLPAIDLECYGCGHTWQTRARAGMSIRCPECRHVRRVPKDRPRTDAEARTLARAADSDAGLPAAWAAEAPPASWAEAPGLPGPPCPECGAPTRWTGAHTALICTAHDRPVWHVSPSAAGRAADHVAAIDKSAARRSAELADPEAARAATELLAAEQAEILDQLAALADRLDVTGFPRDDPYFSAARAAGTRYGAVAEMYASRAGRADTLDQLQRVARDAGRFAADVGPWTVQIAELRAELDGPAGALRSIPGRAEPGDDDDQADDDDTAPGRLTPAERAAGIRRMMAGLDPAPLPAMLQQRRALPAGGQAPPAPR